MVIQGYLLSILYGVACILLSLIAYKFGVPKTYTRKIVHVLVGFEWFILYHYFKTDYHFLIVCLAFTLLLALTYKKSLIPMISSEGDNAPGTVYYGVAMSVMAAVSIFLPDFVLPFGIAVVCTSVGDGFAGIIGSLFSKFKGNVKIYKSKTIFGTIAALAFSFLSVLVFAHIYLEDFKWYYILAISVLAAGLELVGGRGLDNLILPFGTSLFSYLLLFVDGVDNYIMPIILTPLVIAAVVEKNVLTVRGVVSAVLLDIVVSAAFGNFGFCILLAFLAFSVVVDKIKKKALGKNEDKSKRGDKRDEIQVLANGFIPAVFAICYLIWHHHVFILAYTAALAEAFSDTCGSGFGAFSRSAFDIFRLKKIESGLSGGVSVVGSCASFLSAAAFPLIAFAFGVLDLKLTLIAGLSAFAGAVFDSFLGSVFQVKYKCESCGKITEKEEHCGDRCSVYSGFKIVNNDVVNLLSSAFASAIAIAVYFVISAVG